VVFLPLLRTLKTFISMVFEKRISVDSVQLFVVRYEVHIVAFLRVSEIQNCLINADGQVRVTEVMNLLNWCKRVARRNFLAHETLNFKAHVKTQVSSRNFELNFASLKADFTISQLVCHFARVLQIVI
jgi:hypothetical protein